jgi:hypothetical protein
MQISWNAGLKQFIGTQCHSGSGGYRVLVAPNPWGPWRQIFTTKSFNGMGNGGESLSMCFPPKWMSQDGRTMWASYSSWDNQGSAGQNHDRLVIVRATVQVSSNA